MSERLVVVCSFICLCSFSGIHTMPDQNESKETIVLDLLIPVMTVSSRVVNQLRDTYQEPSTQNKPYKESSSFIPELQTADAARLGNLKQH